MLVWVSISTQHIMASLMRGSSLCQQSDQVLIINVFHLMSEKFLEITVGSSKTLHFKKLWKDDVSYLKMKKWQWRLFLLEMWGILCYTTAGCSDELWCCPSCLSIASRLCYLGQAGRAKSDWSAWIWQTERSDSHPPGFSSRGPPLTSPLT